MTTVLFDFSDSTTADAWHSIDNRLMGGVSRSTPRADPAGDAVFEGLVSLERKGGLASVRSTPPVRGTPGMLSCILEVRGDGKHDKLGILADDTFDDINNPGRLRDRHR